MDIGKVLGGYYQTSICCFAHLLYPKDKTERTLRYQQTTIFNKLLGKKPMMLTMANNENCTNTVAKGYHPHHSTQFRLATNRAFKILELFLPNLVHGIVYCISF